VRSQPASRQDLFGILLCFFVSGAAGLIYQVAWSKALGLIFGHTVYAIATVLAVFMAGLAAGSAWLGSWSERRTRPVALYAWIELAVAAAGALSLVGLLGVRGLYLAAYPAMGGSKPFLLALRFVSAAIVLFLPTFLMGGTLPILVRGLTRTPADLAARVSRLYWVNTLGAVAGTLLAGFILLPALGLRLTIACAVALNLLAGLVALRISRGPSPAQDRATPPLTIPDDSNTSAANENVNASVTQTASFDPLGTSRRGLLFAFGIVGATAIAYEIAWTRLLAAILGSSTYAFTLMLATFLVGVVIGSILFERWFFRSQQVSLTTFSRSQTWTGLAAFYFLVLFQQIPSVVPPILRATHETFGGLVLAQFVTSALAMLPAAIVFGFNFPAAVVLLARNREADSDHSAAVGRAYAANTLGAIAGAVVTGFWLVPSLGAFRVVAGMAAVNLFLALIFELFSIPRRIPALAANLILIFFVVVSGWSSIFYDRALTSFSTVLYWNLHNHLTPTEAADTFDHPFVADGLNASIAVARSEDYLALTTNGKVDASNRDAPTQLFVGHLGAVFHPALRRVLIVGFGSGMTVSAVAGYSEVQRIDCVEIEPAVIQAAPYLETLNRGVLGDPRVHVVLDDARNFLLTSRDQYDLIISEPSNPWIAGIATLFTDEYYSAVRQRLAVGGIFVQWVQGYALDPADLRMIVATFSKHFPEATLWHAQGVDLVLLGRTDIRPLRFDRLRSLWEIPRLREDFRTLELRQPEGIVAYYLLNDEGVRRMAAGSVLNTDDKTLLEYHAPRALLNHRLSEKNHELIIQFHKGLLPVNLDSFEDRRTLEATADTLFALDDVSAAAPYLRALDSESPTVLTEILHGRVHLSANRLDQAQAAFENALRIDPVALEALHWLAIVDHRRAANTSAESRLAQILQRDPQFRLALADRVQFAEELGDWPAAARAQAALISAAANPAAIEYCRLGEFWLRVPNPAEGEGALLRGVALDPYSFSCHRNLGEFYRHRGQMDLAREHLELIVRFYPDTDPGTFTSLAAVDRALGDNRAALQALRKGHRIFPDDESLTRALTRN